MIYTKKDYQNIMMINKKKKIFIQVDRAMTLY